MSEFGAFVQLGFAHITALDAIDHILFLLALAAIYTPRDWPDILWVVTAFTVGHSLTLALAVTGTVRVESSIVEFLIPLTIVATCIENIVVRARARPSRVRNRPILAGVFGLVHGAGFAGYLQNAFGDNVGLPLAGFNFGIEAGQIVVLLAVFAFLHLLDGVIARSRAVSSRWPVVRLRSAGVSALIMIVAVRWAVLRSPW